MNATTDIVAKLWNLCNVLRDDGITYLQYVTELTYLLFLKMMQETEKENILPEGYRWDDLVSKEAEPLGRACIFPGDSKMSVTAVDVCIIRSGKNGINHEWLISVLNSPKIRKAVEILSSGTTRKRISRRNLATIQIPLPPLNEQKRIVAKIEALQTRSTVVKEELSAIKPLLDQFRQSVLAAAFRGDLTKDWREQNSDVETNKTRLQSPIVIGEGEGIIPDIWKWSLLTEIAKLESGHTPRKSVSEYWEDGDVPWICLKDIRAAHGKVIENTLHMPTMLGIENSSARLLPKGTVCFSRDISVGFVTIMGRSMATTQHFANWICSNQLFNRYLMYAFMASRYSLIQSGEGTTVRTIYMPALKKMRVVLPPLEEQKEIVRRIESLFKLADSIEQQHQQAEVDLETLNQSILAKAFRGELVPQDPNDEPASVLLERIRKERDRAKAAAKKSKTKKKSTSKKQDKQLGIPGM